LTAARSRSSALGVVKDKKPIPEASALTVEPDFSSGPLTLALWIATQLVMKLANNIILSNLFIERTPKELTSENSIVGINYIPMVYGMVGVYEIHLASMFAVRFLNFVASVNLKTSLLELH